jgi:hypothetical protein
MWPTDAQLNPDILENLRRFLTPEEYQALNGRLALTSREHDEGPFEWSGISVSGPEGTVTYDGSRSDLADEARTWFGVMLTADPSSEAMARRRAGFFK